MAWRWPSPQALSRRAGGEGGEGDETQGPGASSPHARRDARVPVVVGVRASASHRDISRCQSARGEGVFPAR